MMTVRTTGINEKWQKQDWSFFSSLLDLSLEHYPDQKSLAFYLCGAALQLEIKASAIPMIQKAKELVGSEVVTNYVLVVNQLQLARTAFLANQTEKALLLFQTAWRSFGSLMTPLFYSFLCQEAEQQLENGDARSAIQTWQDIASIMQAETPEHVYHRMSHCYVVNQQGFGGTEEENKTWGDFQKHDLLKLFHRYLQPDFYFEIGVDEGKSLACAQGNALGVDARPQLKLSVDLSEQSEVLGISSDCFFREMASEKFTIPVDLAFIDGMHLFEFALRDFMNFERYAAPYALVGVDDIFPCHPIQAERRRVSNSWAGDVWKLVPILQKYRPDLTLVMIPCSTTGMLLITGLNPNSRVLHENYDEILEAYQTDITVPDFFVQRVNAVPSSHPIVSFLLSTLRYAKQSNATLKEIKAALARFQQFITQALKDTTLPAYTDYLYQLKQESTYSRATMTMYWRTSETEYNEQNTVKCDYILNGSLTELNLALPNDLIGLTRVRFDVANTSGCFFIEQFDLFDAQSQLLWQFNMEVISNVKQLSLMALTDQNKICLVSEGLDPQFELIISEENLTRLAGGEVKIKLIAQDYKA